MLWKWRKIGVKVKFLFQTEGELHNIHDLLIIEYLVFTHHNFHADESIGKYLLNIFVLLKRPFFFLYPRDQFNLVETYAKSGHWNIAIYLVDLADQISQALDIYHLPYIRFNCDNQLLLDIFVWRMSLIILENPKKG